jgi:hypothetical protein
VPSGFNATLVTFAAGNQILASQMNANFNALNQATIFTAASNAWQLNSDGGKLTSDNNGNLLCAKLGVVTPGDRIDALTTTGTLYLNGDQKISFAKGGTITFSVTPTGAQVETSAQGGLAFTTGTLRLSNTFVGTTQGTYNHGLSDMPNWAMALSTTTFNPVCGVASASTNTIFVTITGGYAPFICWLVV